MRFLRVLELSIYVNSVFSNCLYLHLVYFQIHLQFEISIPPILHSTLSTSNLNRRIQSPPHPLRHIQLHPIAPPRPRLLSHNLLHPPKTPLIVPPHPPLLRPPHHFRLSTPPAAQTTSLFPPQCSPATSSSPGARSATWRGKSTSSTPAPS